MSLKKGDRVRHPIKAEWGLGEVLTDSQGEKVRVYFVGAGEKTISRKHVTLDCIPKDEAAHPVLDNLRVPTESGRMRYQSLPESIERFLERFPQGFSGDRFAKEERDYKVRAHHLAQDLLSQSALARLLSENDCGEVCRRALRVANATNLIFPHEKMALKDGLASPANQQAFATALFHLLYGHGDLQPRFGRDADILGGIGAAKWTIATYFLFIVYPEEYVFLKPTVTQNAVDIDLALGHPSKLSPISNLQRIIMKHPTVRLSVILALGILVTPLAADAQLPQRLFRLGYVLPGSPGAYTTSLRGLRQGLHDLGYLEGQNLVIEERYAEGQMERLPAIFTELMGLKVDILVAPGTAIARAAQQATASIPIVAIMGDPIGTGLAASLAHPDGNVTGISTLSGEGFSGKWLELLKEMMPHVSRVAYLWNPTNPVSASNVKMLQRVAPALSLRIQSVQVASPEEFERAFTAITSEGAEALILEAEPLLVSYRSQIVQFAAQHRLPVVAQHRAFVEADGVMSYGPNFFELWRRIASYVDRVCKGAKPGDLPIEQAMQFELVINLKAAKALDLTIPPTLLFQANEVIR